MFHRRRLSCISIWTILLVGLPIIFIHFKNDMKNKEYLILKYINADTAKDANMEDLLSATEDLLSKTMSDEESKRIEILKSHKVFTFPNKYGADEDYIPNDVIQEDLTIDINPTATNVTPPDTRILIYNRVPKCGSTLMYNLYKMLAKKNDFDHIHSKVYDSMWVNERNQISLLEYLNDASQEEIISFDRHLYYFNVTRLGFAKVAWMNIVRNPVSRFISVFYYIRRRQWFNAGKMRKGAKPPPDWWYEMTLDDCMKAKRPECYFEPKTMMNQQLSFFCGHHLYCRELGNRYALQRAKRHVENYFSVVGILEEMHLSLSVFEKYLPRFFKNVHKTKLGSGDVKLNENTSKAPNPVSNATLKILHRMFNEEMEFYEFIKQRLYLQADSLGLRKSME